MTSMNWEVKRQETIEVMRDVTANVMRNSRRYGDKVDFTSKLGGISSKATNLDGKASLSSIVLKTRRDLPCS